jgi:hypothetical protein
LWSRRVLMSIAQTEPFRSMMIGSEAGAGGGRDASLDRTPTQPWDEIADAVFPWVARYCCLGRFLSFLFA